MLSSELALDRLNKGTVIRICMISRLGRNVLSSTVYGTIATVRKAKAVNQTRRELGYAEPALGIFARVARNKAEAKEIATIWPRIMKRAALPRRAGCREPVEHQQLLSERRKQSF